MIIVLICIGVIVDLTACWSYCSYKNYKEIRKKLAVQTAEGKEQLEKKNQQKESLKQTVILLLFRWLESIIRLNLLITAYFPSHHVRNFLYRNIFRVHIGKNAVIYYGAEIRSPWNLHIGEGSVIGDRAILDARNGIYIGENVNLSSGVWIWTLQHDVNDPYFATNNEGKCVKIGDRAWLSCRSVILPGVTIGEGCVIAASAVAAKSTEAFSIYGGVPCKKIADRNPNLEYRFNGFHLHFL